ncbi:PilN domain-containing protein [Bacillaceae bacterium W0354]
MLVDINLLPEKEKQRYPIFLRLLFMSALTTVVFLVGFYFTWDTYDDIDHVESRLNQERQAVNILEAQIIGDEDQQRIKRLEKIIGALDKGIVSVSNSLNETIRLLPKGTVLESLQFTNEQVDLTIRANNNEQPIIFLHSLQNLFSPDNVTIHAISLLETKEYVASYTIVFQVEGNESHE